MDAAVTIDGCPEVFPGHIARALQDAASRIRSKIRKRSFINIYFKVIVCQFAPGFFYANIRKICKDKK
ncbi:MAG: hypothetical protein K2M05_06255, partial [Paramuribaculum sp.]|nr:hypothetical protein [Paramuribaculum sp.]